MAELGIISAKGRNGTAELLRVIANTEDDRIPPVARFCLDLLARQYMARTQRSDQSTSASTPGTGHAKKAGG